MPDKYNFTVHLKTDKGNEVHIDPAALYGYWERSDGSEGGGLWFEVHESSTDGDAGRKLELTDFDGDFELPQSIVKKMREEGYVLDESFD